MTKNFLLLLQGQFISQIGTQIFILFVLYWFLQETSSSIYMAIFMIAATLPAILISPFGGKFADNHSKRNIIVYTDLFSGLIMLFIGISFFYITNIQIQSIVLIISAVFLSLLNGFFQPSILSFIPFLSNKDNLKQHNALIQSTEQGAKALGFAIGGSIFFYLDLSFLLIINGLSFILSSLSEFFINEKGKIIHRKNIDFNFIQYFKNEKPIFSFFVLVVLFNFLYSPFMVFLPIHLDNLGFDSKDLGFLLFTYAFGQLFSFISIYLFKKEINSKIIIELAFIICPLMLILLTTFNNFSLKMLFLFIQGFSIGLINVLLISLMQEKTEKEIQGKLFGILKLFAGISIPIGMILSAFFIQETKQYIDNIFIISGIITILVFFYFKLFNKSYCLFYKIKEDTL